MKGEHKNTKWTKEIVAKWDKMLREGYTYDDIKERFGVAKSTLSEKIAAYRSHQ
jgi:transposase